MAHKKYDRQLIVAFLSGDADSGAIKRATPELEAKAKKQTLETASVYITVDEDKAASWTSEDREKELKSLSDALPKLTDNSRLYIAGHGDKAKGKLGNWSGEGMAKLLKACGLSKTPLVSVTGCKSATTWDDKLQKSDQLKLIDMDDAAFSSFAGKFHKALGSGVPSLKCVLYARVFNVVVIGERLKVPQMVGRKVTVGIAGHPIVSHFNMTYGSKQTKSKRRYYWKDGAQCWEWVTYLVGEEVRENVTMYPNV